MLRACGLGLLVVWLVDPVPERAWLVLFAIATIGTMRRRMTALIATLPFGALHKFGNIDLVYVAPAVMAVVVAFQWIEEREWIRKGQEPLIS